MSINTSPHRLRISKRNTRSFMFRLRDKGENAYWDISAATEARIEWENIEGVVQTPVLADLNHPQADLANGKLIVTITGADIAANVGSFPYNLSIFIGGAEVTVVSGHIEVTDRAIGG